MGPVERFDRKKQANYTGCTLICISTYFLFVLCLFIARYDHYHAEALAKDTFVVLNQNEKTRDRLKVAIVLVDGIPKLLQINYLRDRFGFGSDFFRKYVANLT
jgi:bacterioferritin (cytochrome b1)